MKNKFIIFVVLFIIVFAEEEDDSSHIFEDTIYYGEAGDSCTKKGENCGSVTLPEGYKCCLQAATYDDDTDYQCYPLKLSKIDEFIKLSKGQYMEEYNVQITINCDDGEKTNTDTNQTSNDSGNKTTTNSTDSSSSSYLFIYIFNYFIITIILNYNI